VFVRPAIVGDAPALAEVDLLSVDPGFAGRGVARLALDAVEAEARGREWPRSLPTL
jgi:GNAT superfamily N-acetyltransferase